MIICYLIIIYYSLHLALKQSDLVAVRPKAVSWWDLRSYPQQWFLCFYLQGSSYHFKVKPLPERWRAHSSLWQNSVFSFGWYCLAFCGKADGRSFLYRVSASLSSFSSASLL